MQAHIQWDEQDDAILLIHFAEAFTWEDYHDTIAQASAMAAEKSGQFDVLLLSHVDVPKGNALPHFKEMLSTIFSFDNMGVFVAAGQKQNLFVKMLVRIIAGLNGIDSDRLHIVHYESEARQLIAESRQRSG